jgi:hypothetical protein
MMFEEIEGVELCILKRARARAKVEKKSNDTENIYGRSESPKVMTNQRKQPN